MGHVPAYSCEPLIHSHVRCSSRQPGMISIRRTRLIEVLYTLRVTVNSSIYVDLPITLINFLSIDPPPMPSDGMRFANRAPTQQRVPDHGAYGRPQTHRMQSQESVSSSGLVAKASSTTLHLDALLQAGRARAEADGQADPPLARARPLSMGSEYTLDRSTRSFDVKPGQPSGASPAKGVTVRPKGARMMSYLSTRSHSETSSLDGDDQDKALLAVRRAQGRQLSLAAIGRAISRAAAADAEDDLLSPTRESVDGDYFPAQTPTEEVYRIMGDTPGVANEAEHRSPFDILGAAVSRTEEAPASEEVRQHNVIPEVPEEEEADLEQESADDEDNIEAGNETVLDDLVAKQADDGPTTSSPVIARDYGGYDYADDVEDGDESFATITKRESLPRHLPSLNIDPRLSFATPDMDRQQHIAQTRSINGSFATDGESEIGQVYEVVKRNVSMRLPPIILPFDAPTRKRASLSVPVAGAGPRRSSHTPTPTRELGSVSGRGSGGRRGSAPSTHPHQGALGMRRESTNPQIPSPLRPAEESLQARIVSNKSSFSFVTPGSPLRAGASSISPGKPLSFSPGRHPTSTSSGVSPRSAQPVMMLDPSSPTAEKMSRQPSANSQLQHQVPVSSTSTAESDGEGGPPGLAPSVAFDSASSEGHALESPPIAVLAKARSPKNRALPKAPDLSGFIMKSSYPPEAWIPPDHMLHTTVNLMHNPHPREPVSPPESSGSSTHSILPSVRSKIAQLETRDEALRKFSVSASTQSQPERPPATKRRSYTSALAPRPVRSASDDLYDQHQLGGTTFVSRKPFAEQTRISYNPGERRILRRNGSASSTSTSATTIEAALSGWGCSTRSREMGRPRGYAAGVEPSYVEDDYADESGVEMGQWEVLRPVSGIGEETDDSEGLL